MSELLCGGRTWILLAGLVIISPAIASPAPTGLTREATGPTADDAEVRDAARRFYRALAERDEATLARMIPREGFTEFPGSGGPLEDEGLARIRAGLAAGLVVDVRLENVRVVRLGADAALVTADRHGVVAAGPPPHPAQIKRMTMVMRREQGEWRIVHAHLSPALEGGASVLSQSIKAIAEPAPAQPR